MKVVYLEMTIEFMGIDEISGEYRRKKRKKVHIEGSFMIEGWWLVPEKQQLSQKLGEITERKGRGLQKDRSTHCTEKPGRGGPQKSHLLPLMIQVVPCPQCATSNLLSVSVELPLHFI